MAFNDLFKLYPNRNSELRTLVKTMVEFGRTIAKEPSAAHSNGIDEHALRRQRSYVHHAEQQVQAIAARPIPDNPATHPTDLPIDLSMEYITFVTDVNGNKVPLNESTQLLAEKWMITAVELAKSQSASMAGSMVGFDFDRAMNNLAVVSKMLDELEARPFLDLPETSEPGSEYAPRTSSYNPSPSKPQR
jgi:hypothetical protein